jgi:hypothetical protein
VSKHGHRDGYKFEKGYWKMGRTSSSDVLVHTMSQLRTACPQDGSRVILSLVQYHSKYQLKDRALYHILRLLPDVGQVPESQSSPFHYCDN